MADDERAKPEASESDQAEAAEAAGTADLPDLSDILDLGRAAGVGDEEPDGYPVYDESEHRDELSLVERSVLTFAPAAAPGIDDEDEDVADEAPASSAVKALRWLSPRMLALVLLLVAGAGVTGTAVTLVHPFRDWFMHLLMYVVIFSFFLLYLKAHVRRRGFLRYLMMLISVALMGFFGWILYDVIPAQKVWYARSVVPREEVTTLFVPIALLGVGAVIVLLHCIAVSRHVRRGRA